MPQLGLLEKIEKDFGSFIDFKEKFTEAALTHFGSGWVWLVCKSFPKLFPHLLPFSSRLHLWHHLVTIMVLKIYSTHYIVCVVSSAEQL